MKYLKYNLFILVLHLCLGCEKKLELNLQASNPKLVIEGAIATGNFPALVLTQSVGFGAAIDISKVKFISNAQLQLTDLTINKTIQLREYNLDTVFNNQQFKLIVYTIDFANPDHLNFKGQTKHEYKLQINYENKVYEAFTGIPKGVRPDSLWLEKSQLSDTTFLCRIMWKDPDTIGNYHRYETSILRKNKKMGLNEGWLSSFISVFDDKVNNGARLPVFIEMGYEKVIDLSSAASRNLLEQYRTIYKGDTVLLRFSGIDYNTYNYWTTLEYSRNSTGNPFSSPTKVKGNITNDGIGIFGGYDPHVDTIIAK